MRTFFKTASWSVDAALDQMQKSWVMALEQNGKIRNELEALVYTWMSKPSIFPVGTHNERRRVMVKEYLKVAYFLQELEEANGKVLFNLLFMAKLANISICIMARGASRHHEDVDLCFHLRRTIDNLQRESFRQAHLLTALKDELIHARDNDVGGESEERVSIYG